MSIHKIAIDNGLKPELPIGCSFPRILTMYGWKMRPGEEGRGLVHEGTDIYPQFTT